MTEVMKRDQQILQQQDNSVATLMQVITAAAADARVDPSKLEALLNLQERLTAKQSEIEFNQDYALAADEMPRVKKLGVIDMGSKGSMPFAKYEHLDEAIRPIEKRYGFTRSFSNRPAAEGIELTLTVTHRAGHSRTSSMMMPPDAGAGRNAMQARGSASSYAKRYLTKDFWNIITVGEDDDAKAVGFIDDAQLSKITDMLSAIEESMSAEARPLVASEFLKYMGVKVVREIKKADYARAMNGLQIKLKSVRGK